MIVTVLCKGCESYFRMEAFEPEDLIGALCFDCEEKAEQAACSHDHVHVERFGAGRCMETGYHDAGELIVCEDCGFQEVA